MLLLCYYYYFIIILTLDCRGLPLIGLDCTGPPRITSDCSGSHKIALDHLRPPSIDLGCSGLPWYYYYQYCYCYYHYYCYYYYYYYIGLRWIALDWFVLHWIAVCGWSISQPCECSRQKRDESEYEQNACATHSLEHVLHTVVPPLGLLDATNAPGTCESEIFHEHTDGKIYRLDGQRERYGWTKWGNWLPFLQPWGTRMPILMQNVMVWS